MPRMVIYQQNREEVLKRIEDESGAKPGAPGMFKHYQAAVKRVMAELDEDELEKAKETAEEWPNNFPPPKVQAQVTQKKGPAYMEHFLKEMWRQCRMRVFVLSAWKNEQGEVLFGMHDDNEALGDGDSFMKMKDWEAIETVWQEYAQEQFVDGDGMPVLLDITETKLEEKKAIVRAFLTSHYRLCSGNDKAVIPWSAIIHSQDDFVARTFLLADVDLKEPSKLQNWDKMVLLNFWYAQQEAGKCPTFLFKAWKNKDSEMVPLVVSSKSPSPATKTIRKRKRAIHQSPEDSLTEAQSDTQETEEEADDDSADSRSPHKRARRVGNPSGVGQKLTVPKSLPKPRQTKTANDDPEYVAQATRQHALGDQRKRKEVVYIYHTAIICTILSA
ncbi:hypothetical protein BDR04DRAFT_1160845 [Suillus decipiens]|nr:hypothetical protein BDR04DRAFT_1160845 [Suillus decipiens]